MITLSKVPKHYPECCLSISEALFACIACCLSELQAATQITESGVKATTILSIGCGTGFLEAVLTAYLQKLGFHRTQVEGVEVASADVKYLPSELVYRVPGTRSICQHAGTADILLFIYPREGELVRQYLTRFSNNVCMVLWLGPRADWIAQQQILWDISPFSGPHLMENSGLTTYEVAVVFHNRTAVGCQKQAVVPSQDRIRPQMKQDAQHLASEEFLSLDIDSI